MGPERKIRIENHLPLPHIPSGDKPGGGVVRDKIIRPVAGFLQERRLASQRRRTGAQLRAATEQLRATQEGDTDTQEPPVVPVPEVRTQDTLKKAAKVAGVVLAVGAGAYVANRVLSGGHEAGENSQQRSLVRKAAGTALRTATGHMFSDENIAATDSTVVKGLKETANVVAPAVEIGVAGAGLGVAGITILHHRELTHKSAKTRPWLRKLIEVEQKTLGVFSPPEWAKVHRFHHRWTDLKGKRYLNAYRAAEWIKTEVAAGRQVDVEVPTHFRNVHPLVEEFPADKALRVGKIAEDDVAHRMGAAYERPTLTVDDARVALYPAELDVYPDYIEKNGPEEYTQAEKEDQITSDPHSPLYERGFNKVKAMFINNMWRYKTKREFVHHFPELADQDLMTDQDRLPADQRIEPTKWPYIAAGFALPAAAILVTRGKYEPKDVAIAAVGGAIANGARAGLEKKGGDLVNAWGHSGTGKNIVKALFGKEFEIVPNDQGDVARNAAGEGFWARLASIFTYSEGGMQWNHHFWDPGANIYSSAETPLGRTLDDPWGSALDVVARSRLPILDPGEGFELAPGERRPDEPNEAVLIVRGVIADEVRRKKAEAAAGQNGHNILGSRLRKLIGLSTK